MISLKNILYRVKKQSPILYSIVCIHFVGALTCCIALLIDERTLMGINVWIKPLKFSISGGIYILTLGYLITLYPFSLKKKNSINNIVSWTLLLEIVIIFYQAARGTQSHYNMSSAFDGILFALMGILIGINVFIMVLFAIETVRLQLKTTKPIQYAILIGWIFIVFASWIGGQMISQMSHNVGVADGGAGLPLVNWSTVGGDLRVAHFFGLHSIQMIPLFAFFINKKWHISNKKQFLFITLFSSIYLICIAYTFYQAKQGIPFI